VGINQLSGAPQTYVIRYCQAMEGAGAAFWRAENALDTVVNPR
jgi:hypothetical protein